MLNIKTLFLTVIAFFVTTIVTKDKVIQSNTVKWILVENGSLRVGGSTNVNKFNCDISNYNNHDTIFLNKTNAGIQLKGNVNLEINTFDCHLLIMTNDLRKTLKAKEFPYLKITFLSFNKYPNFKLPCDIVTGWVEIQLAGATKRFEVSYKFSMGSDKIIRLIGNQNVNFSDFNLVPPRKLGGMIRTDDLLKIEFKLNFKELD
ncbi:MAG: hypothetical protein ABI208_08000 [Ginsengibacter sp.]|jgi:hypothetical protein